MVLRASIATLVVDLHCGCAHAWRSESSAKRGFYCEKELDGGVGWLATKGCVLSCMILFNALNLRLSWHFLRLAGFLPFERRLFALHRLQLGRSFTCCSSNSMPSVRVSRSCVLRTTSFLSPTALYLSCFCGVVYSSLCHGCLASILEFAT